MAGAHMMVDGYGNIFAPMLPLLIPRLGLTLAAAGTLTMCFSSRRRYRRWGSDTLRTGGGRALLVMIGRSSPSPC